MNLKYILLISYFVVWVFAAIDPVVPFVWLIENILIFIMIPIIIRLEKRHSFSNTSALFIFLFLLLHTLGAHFTYSEMPGLDFLTEFFHFQRNNYDRFVHFMFGFLIFLPLAETLAVTVNSRNIIIALSVMILFAVSSFYEIFEWLAAISAQPEVGLSVLGSQGDVWDAQKDMGLAHLGALLAMLIWRHKVFPVSKIS